MGGGLENDFFSTAPFGLHAVNRTAIVKYIKEVFFFTTGI
jgi:hypothetical protein